MTDLAKSSTEKRWFGAEEAGAKLGISGRTVRRLAKDRELASYRIGGQVRFAAADLDEYLRKVERPASS